MFPLTWDGVNKLTFDYFLGKASPLNSILNQNFIWEEEGNDWGESESVHVQSAFLSPLDAACSSEQDLRSKSVTLLRLGDALIFSFSERGRAMINSFS